MYVKLMRANFGKKREFNLKNRKLIKIVKP